MIFNVAQLLKAAVGTTRTYAVDESLPQLDEGIQLTELVRGTVQFIRTNRGILVNARLKTAAKEECSRCLDVYVEPLNIRFSEEYIPIVDVVTGQPTHIPHESYAFLINERHELDLTPAVREYGVLEIPMKPLCQTDCAGLCPHCGVNLNQKRCQCVVQAKDERFAILESLLIDQESTDKESY
ncbi:MAG TPA: DUF177 domain-containing protein [Chloroflexota bacterium]|nr:DUF177 domain-containing protein [Chloroflexota bacterium]